MFLFAVPVLTVLGGLVFVCAWPFLRRPVSANGRFGESPQPADLMLSLIRAFRRGFDLSGRSDRGDFWRLAVVAALVELALAVAFIAVAVAIHNNDFDTEHGVSPMWLLAIATVAVALLIPCFTMAVRRLHDVGRSGWWLALVFVFGYFILLYWWLQPSQPGTHDTARIFE